MCKGKVSRRGFLKGITAASAGMAAWGVVPGMANVSNAQSVSGKRLLVVNFAGGYDSLGVCQPDMGALADLRPTLFRNDSLALNGTNLGFHHSMPTMQGLYNSGDLAICHKVGYDNGSRSHAEAENAFARGVPDRSSGEQRGWVNRLGLVNFNSAFHVIDFSGGHNTTSQGGYLPTALRRLDDFGFENDYTQSSRENNQRRDRALSMLSDWKAGSIGEQSSLRNGWMSVRDSVDRIEQIVASASFPGGNYPNSSIGRAFRDAQISFEGLDTKIAYVRYSGFDTHGGQESRITSLMGGFDTALGTFIANMQAKGLWNSMIVLCVSEFARTNAENGNQGTDHGFACDQYLLGPGVRGGVYGAGYTSSDFTTSPNWLMPSLNMVDIYRSVVAEMGYDPNRIFESSGSAPLNLFT